MSETSDEQEQALTIPTSQVADSIIKALERAFNTVITMLECKIKLAIPNGENFCSDIYRVYVKFHSGSDYSISQEKTLILKVAKEIELAGSNELDMFAKVLPEMENILSAAVDGEQLCLNAKCLWSEQRDKDIYILEDLNAKGYTVADRKIGLNEEHAKVLLKKIAQFHAASMVYAEKFPVETKALQASHFSEGAADVIANAIAVGGMEYAIKIIESWNDFAEITTKMRANIKKFDERVKDCGNPQKSNLNVINHGDLWSNNFLFSYHENQPNDVVFVDFQNCFFGSAAFDLNYFLYTSLQLQVLQTKRYELLRHYYTVLKATLKSCGWNEKIPTWQTIVEEVRHCAFIGYYAAVCELPICCMSKAASEGFTIATFSDSNALARKRKFLYNNERVINTLRYTLDYFNELGILD